MRKRLLVLAILPILLLLVSAQVILAEDSTNTTNTFENKEKRFLNFLEKKTEKRLETSSKIQDKKSDVRENIATKTAQMREKFRSGVKVRLGGVVEALVKHAERLGKITEKIQSRLDRLSGASVDVSVQQAALDSCNSQLAEIDAAIAETKTKVGAIAAQGNNDGAIQNAQASIKVAKEKLHAYNRCLHEVVKSMRSLKTDKLEDES